MAWHLAKIEMAFGAARAIDPADVPNDAWINVTNDVSDWDVTRGRSDELGEIVAAEGSLTLDNEVDGTLPAGRYSPDHNPDPLNLLDPERSTGGSAAGGTMPDGVRLNTGLTAVALTVNAMNDAAAMYPFGFDVNVTAGFAGTPILYLGADADVPGTQHDVRSAMRVAPSTSHRMRLQHKLISGTGQALRFRIYWLDSNGAVLSTIDSSSFTPTGTVAQANLTASSPAGARYATIGVVWVAALAAVQRVRFTAIQFGEYSSTTMTSQMYYPNIRPGVPVRLTLRNSTDTTYHPVFYGHAGEWEEDPNDLTVTVALTDALELLAEIDLDTATTEAVKQIAPDVWVPLSDPSDTRKQYTVTALADPDREISRTIFGTANARDLSEYVFGEPGPQDGLTALRLDPESVDEGYFPLITPPADLLLGGDPAAGGSEAWWVAVWFRVKRKESGARAHGIFTALESRGDYPTAQIQMMTSGALFFGTWRADTGALINTGSTFQADGTPWWDGEWHLAYMDQQNSGGATVTRLRVDGTTLTVTDTLAASTTWWSGRAERKGYTYSFGGSPTSVPNETTALRGWLSGAMWGTGAVLTDTELDSLFKVSVPPAQNPGETEVDRIDRLLDFAGWPATMRDLDASVAVMNGPYPSGVNALEAIKQIAEQAGGRIWIDKSGLFRYSSRRARYNPTTGLTCSHAAGTMPEDTLKPRKGTEWVYNRVSVSRASGTPIVVDDLSSQAQYGIRVLELDLPLLSEEDALQGAYWHLHLYSQPRARIGSLTFAASAATADTLWDYLVAVDLMDSAGIVLDAVNLEGHVYLPERIVLEYDAGEKLFQGTLDVSPGDQYQAICVFDSGTFDDCIFGW